MKFIKLSTLGMIFLLTACATGPVHKNYKDSDAACIEGDTANFIKFFTEGEAHVRIAEMDDIETNTSTVCVAPGEHKLGFTAANNGQMTHGFIVADFEPNKKYKVRANRNGLGFNCVFYDITDGSEKPLKSFRTQITSHMPTYVPIYLPASK